MRFENLFRYCPVCGSNEFHLQNVKSKKCADCGFTFYVNPSSAVACLIVNEHNELLVCKRAKEPAKGTFDLPGGFVDENESAETALCREIEEELNAEVKSLSYLFSLPNEYKYSGFTLPTLDMIYRVELKNNENLTAADDVESINWIPLEKIDPAGFGLKSIRKAVEIFKKNLNV